METEPDTAVFTRIVSVYCPAYRRTRSAAPESMTRKPDRPHLPRQNVKNRAMPIVLLTLFFPLLLGAQPPLKLRLNRAGIIR